MAFTYPDIDFVIMMHDLIIKVSGGKLGVSNRNLLESVIGHVKNNDYYPEFQDKMTHLVYSINKNHAFNDGNKRTSIAIGAGFMLLNGYEDFQVDYFIEQMESVVIAIASNDIDKEELKEIIAALTMMESYSEELKLKVIESLQKYNKYAE